MQHRTVIGLVEDRKSLFESRNSVSFLNLPLVTLFLQYNNNSFVSLLDKEIIDQHTKEIEELKNKPAFEMPEMPDVGDGLDMGQLMKIFASKSPPDNTINRIEALEKLVADLSKVQPPAPVEVQVPVASAGPGLDQDALDKLNDLLRRV